MRVDAAHETASTEAERWLLRLREPDCTDAERREFEHWLQAADDHRIAFEQAERLWERLGEAVQLPEVRAMPEAVLPPRRERRAWPAWRSWAAAAAACLVLVAGYQLYQTVRRPAPEQFQTAVGETRSVTLADSSTITLDTDSHIAVRYGWRERDIEMVRGAAFFDVQPDDARPFAVSTTLGRATVLGTRFQIRSGPDELDVVLVSGSLRLDRGGLDRAAEERAPHDASVVLRPGQRATLTRDEPTWQTSEADIEALTAWRQQRLIFRDTPLPEAVAEINRYNATQLHIGDPSLASLLVNGVFRTGDPDSFVLALEATLPVRARAAAGGARILLPAEMRRP